MSKYGWQGNMMMHLCEWCRKHGPLTHMLDIDQYLCEACQDDYREAKANAWDKIFGNKKPGEDKP